MRLSCIHIRHALGKGRGVFSRKFIPADKIIESAPVIVMNANDRALLDQTLLHDYIFEWLPNGENLCCMALGWIPMYNHSFEANCEYFMDYPEELMFIKTVRAIEPNEELTINYNGDWNNDAKLWFQTVD
jgi:hypothetical protein